MTIPNNNYLQYNVILVVCINYNFHTKVDVYIVMLGKDVCLCGVAKRVMNITEKCQQEHCSFSYQFPDPYLH